MKITLPRPAHPVCSRRLLGKHVVFPVPSVSRTELSTNLEPERCFSSPRVPSVSLFFSNETMPL